MTRSRAGRSLDVAEIRAAVVLMRLGTLGLREHENVHVVVGL